MHPRSPLSLSTLALVAANLVPLIGVLFFGWEIFSIVLLYWAENIIVGLFTVARILVAAGPAAPATASPTGAANVAGRLFLALFFTVHYGIFTAVHGVFVFTLFSPDGPGHAPIAPIATASTAAQGGLILAFLGLLLSHALSFVTNDLIGGERLHYAPPQAMFRPYPRIIPLHIGIILGGAAIQFLGSPLLLLLCIVIGKLLLDLSLHRRSHNRIAPGHLP